MKLIFTKNFIQKYRKLPQHIRKATDKQLRFLLTNPDNPSLNIKKMKDPRDIWEGRITHSYRFTFHIAAEHYILRNIGTHDILNKP